MLFFTYMFLFVDVFLSMFVSGFSSPVHCLVSHYLYFHIWFAPLLQSALSMPASRPLRQRNCVYGFANPLGWEHPFHRYIGREVDPVPKQGIPPIAIGVWF